jgi:hypothetical protein
MIDAVLPLPAYRAHRPALRREAIAHRRARTVQLGPAMRVQFEDVHGVRHQVHEVLHAERGSDPAAVRQTVADFAHLLPDGRRWVATLFIELPDRRRREAELPGLSAAVHTLRLQVDGAAPIAVDANWDLPDRHLGRPSATHFLRFAPGADALRGLRAGRGAALVCAHPAYGWCCRLPAALAQRLRAEIDDPTEPA